MGLESAHIWCTPIRENNDGEKPKDPKPEPKPKTGEEGEPSSPNKPPPKSPFDIPNNGF